MTEELYVVVAFRVDEENSILYRKCRTLADVNRAVSKAFRDKGADFISIRRVQPSKGFIIV